MMAAGEIDKAWKIMAGGVSAKRQKFRWRGALSYADPVKARVHHKSAAARSSLQHRGKGCCD